MQLSLRTGTSGFNYKEWHGPFYPEGLAVEEELGYYASQLPAVEINNTFYRVPKGSVVAHWREQVPADFRFAIKSSRRVTHVKKLKDADEPLGFVLRSLEPLDETLGALLFQLPPYLRADLGLLSDFLALLPEGLPACFEFRHRSWWGDDIAQALSERGLPLVVSESDEADIEALRATPDTADWGYLRLRKADYSEDELAGWCQWLAERPWQRAMVFFKHETEGAGPKLARRFAERFGAG